MTEITFVINDWFLFIVSVCLIVSCVNYGLRSLIAFLDYRLEKQRKTAIENLLEAVKKDSD